MAACKQPGEKKVKVHSVTSSEEQNAEKKQHECLIKHVMLNKTTFFPSFI